MLGNHDLWGRKASSAALAISMALSGFLWSAKAQGTVINIQTVAGGGVGDMAPATQGALANPNAIVLDAMGNAFIADTDNHRIRKVAADGTITTVAGTGTFGFGGDGMAATAAFLFGPRGLVVDATGNIFIADTNNHRIRKLDMMTGNISTVAGTGTRGFSGDGAAATSAQLNFPRSVALGAMGLIYIADTNNQRIRKVDPMTGIISTLAGDGTQGAAGDGADATKAKLNFPTGVAVDSMGNILIADSNNHCIRKVTPANMNFITSVAGVGSPGFTGDGMAATTAKLNLPTGISIGPGDSLVISDMGNSRIRRVNPMGGIISTVAGSGNRGFAGDGSSATAMGARLDTPFSVTASGTSLFIADSANQRIRKVDAAGVITTFAGGGVGDGNTAGQGALQVPGGIAVDAMGTIYIADTGHHRIRRVQTVGMMTTISTLAGTGEQGLGGDNGMAAAAKLNQPEGVAVDAGGNVFVADTGNHRIRKIDPSGLITTVAGTDRAGSAGDMGPATQAQLRFPFGVALDGTGSLYIADTSNNRVRKVDAMGIIATIAGTGVRGFSGDGDMTAAKEARLNLPLAVAVRKNGEVLIADAGNHRIRRVNAMGTINTVAGSGTQGFAGDGMAATMARFNFPWSLFIDGMDNLFIADFGNARIRRVDAAAMTISTVIGTGNLGFAGDGGPASAAQIIDPRGVAVDAAGNIYVSDSGNHRVRRTVTATGM